MTLKNKNPWKYLSVGLLGVIAIGLFAPAQAAPGDALSGWQAAVADLQTQVDAAVGDFQGQIDALVADLATEASDRAAADTAEESRATTAEAGIASDLAAHELADGDLSPTNEIQSLSETDGVISLSGDGSVTVQDRVSSTCAAGSSIRAIAADGTVTCEADTDTNTTYTAGTGLALTGTEFSADSTLQKRVSSTCAAGSSIRVISATGGVTCETDTDTNTTYDGTDFATSNQSCAAGKVVTGVDASGAVTCATDANTGFPSVYYIQNSKSIGGTLYDSVTATCDAGDTMLNYGHAGGSTLDRISNEDMFHSGSGSGVVISFYNGDLASHTYYVEVNCLDFGTPHT